MNDNGWDDSAAAWIADMGELGDFGRRYVLDPVMVPLALAGRPKAMLDVGCGEGRFCRMLASQGVAVTGIDPTRALIDEAQARHPGGTYIEADAVKLPFDGGAFDLVVSCLSLVDIADAAAAIAEMARVLEPGGRLLIANSNGFNTAGDGEGLGWARDANGAKAHFRIDHYLRERKQWLAWRGIRIVNHHRPLSTYMKLLLAQGLRLTHFDEPRPVADAPAARATDYVRAPWFLVMVWAKG
ncbi:MAG: class I SAM-dependent methyltransferase [Alphaproteobacteria bacterium]|nr:class I SAM-dependent methyltransferase [Alphaproteobacteria bacterium]